MGFQAKWFRNAMQDKQFEQIAGSITTALKVRPQIKRYIVAVPRLLGNKRVKVRGKELTTEQDRWDSLKANFAKSHPGLTIELWNHAQLEVLLTKHGGDGLVQYWFAKSAFRHEDLKLRFEQAKSSWLRRRYSPEFHAVGAIESDLSVRLRGLSVSEASGHISELQSALGKAREEVERLLRYPTFRAVAGAEDAVERARRTIDETISWQESLAAAVAAGALRQQLPMEPDPTKALSDILSLIPSNKRLIGLDRFEVPRSTIEKAIDAWRQRTVTPHMLERHLKPAVYIGAPGSGKTHALAHAVESELQNGRPALLIRGKGLDAENSIEKILQSELGVASWNQTDILDALEASAIISHVREVAASGEQDPAPLPVRALIAIDGLDESRNPKKWGECAGGVIPLASKWPRVLLVFSARYSLAGQMPDPAELPRFFVRESDAPLSKLFFDYTKASAIVCPPVVRWALRSPLAIRLFAELYCGTTVRYEDQQFALTELLDKKLSHVDAALQETGGWNQSLKPVQQALLAIVKRCIAEGRALTINEALDAAEEGISPQGIIARSTIYDILVACEEYGLLLAGSSQGEGFNGPTRTWEPAFEILTDFLLAYEIRERVLETPPQRTMPPYIRSRWDAAVLAIAMNGMDGFRSLQQGLWIDDLSTTQIETLQRRALLAAHPSDAAAAFDWVTEQLTSSMPSCRRILSELVVPGFRLPGFPFGGPYVHETLRAFTIGSRDVFWSGPRHLPQNHGAPWEGSGDDVLERLEPADDDAWDSAPLLLSWATTSCNNSLRRKLRQRLAVWGCGKPRQVLSLLKTTTESNDPQMLEDVLTSCYGASALSESAPEWAELCEWLSENRERILGISPSNVEMVHSMRAIVEFWRTRGVYSGVWPLLEIEPRLLRLDPLVLSADRPESACSMMDWDYTGYVIPKAFGPFFRRTRSNALPEEEPPDIHSVASEMLHALVDGQIRTGASEGNREIAARELQRRAKLSELQKQEREKEEKEGDQLMELFDVLSEEEQEALILRVREDNIDESRAMSAAAEELLKAHAEEYGLENLSPEQLAFGYISQRVKELGWSTDVHEKQPRGGKPGEILGIDIAILRKYQQATHGARSLVSTLAGKYIWLARHELVGYLAERLPVNDYSDTLQPPIDPSNFAETPSPATDVLKPETKANWLSDPLMSLAPSHPVDCPSQIELANSWVRDAPMPTVEGLLRVPAGVLDEHAWLVLRTFAKRTDTNTLGESLVWGASLMLSSEQIPLLEEDARFGFVRRLEEDAGGLKRVEFYTDPLETVWAPWVIEDDVSMRHVTLTSEGIPTQLVLDATTILFYWESMDGESEILMPSRQLRAALGIVELCRGAFLDRARARVALYDIEAGQMLLMREDLLCEFLHDNSLSLVWGLRVYREPHTSLLQDDWPRMSREWRGLAVLKDGLISSTEIHDNIEELPPPSEREAKG